ncbi:MAG: DUF760 domain-containing protein [Prochloraceae cyanobacterium]
MNDFQNTDRNDNNISAFFANTNKNTNLEQYLQSLSPETLNQLAKPNREVLQIIQNNVAQMLGGLPPQHFKVAVTTDRESLGQLLASAMMTGYFLKGAENRMVIEKQFQDAQ